MKKSTKGAAAAAAAGVLLLGGAGSLAYWNSTASVPGGAINSGSLALGTPACGAWTLDTLEPAPPATFTAGDPLVPGDVLTKTCTFAITATGNHLRATLGVGSASFTPVNDLSADLTASAVFTVAGNPIPAEITELNNGNVVSAAITVTFDPESGNESQSLGTVLSAITVTANQVHTTNP
jgi:alternate signal-mediated exported protein